MGGNTINSAGMIFHALQCQKVRAIPRISIFQIIKINILKMYEWIKGTPCMKVVFSSEEAVFTHEFLCYQKLLVSFN